MCRDTLRIFICHGPWIKKPWTLLNTIIFFIVSEYAKDERLCLASDFMVTNSLLHHNAQNVLGDFLKN